MKKKKFKSAASIALVTTMLLSVTACGGNGNTNSNAGNTAANNGNVNNANQTGNNAAADDNSFGFSTPVKLNVGFAFSSDFKAQGQETETQNTWT